MICVEKKFFHFVSNVFAEIEALEEKYDDDIITFEFQALTKPDSITQEDNVLVLKTFVP